MWCEHCGSDGRCCVCGGQLALPDAVTEDKPAPVGWSVRDLQARVAVALAEYERAQRDLRDALEAEGRRPGDGSDQPTLWGGKATTVQAIMF